MLTLTGAIIAGIIVANMLQNNSAVEQEARARLDAKKEKAKQKKAAQVKAEAEEHARRLQRFVRGDLLRHEQASERARQEADAPASERARARVEQAKLEFFGESVSS